jgi:hypothetical protein
MLRDKSRTAGPAHMPDLRVFYVSAIIYSHNGVRSQQALTGARAPVAKHRPEV